MTDWGNFNYCLWSIQEDIRNSSYILMKIIFHAKCFKVFLINAVQKKMEDCCKRFASKVLPTLKEAIKKELVNTEE